MRADVRRVLDVPGANRDNSAVWCRAWSPRWLLLFIASVRELGASILLMGPHSKVITPSIVESWFGTSSELTAALALIQTLVVACRHDRARCRHAPRRRANPSTKDVRNRHHASVAARSASHRLHRRTRTSRSIGLELYYGSVPAVRGVSFNVLPGEQLTLLRPSGCGKTTTLRAIAGLEQPTAGEIRIDGVPLSIRRNSSINVRAEKRGLSMVFQSYAIWPHMTVFENVAYGLRVRRTGAAEVAEKVHQALEHGADAQLRIASSGAAVRRTAAAGCTGARLRVPAFGAVVRRTAIESRCQIARRYADRTARASASPRHHLGLRAPTIWKKRWQCRTASS